MSQNSTSPTSPTDAAAGYVDIVKWVVGLVAAVFAGFFLHPEYIAHWEMGPKLLLAFVLFLFGLSIISGVAYPFWLYWTRRQKEKLAEIDAEIAKTYGRKEVEELTKKKERIKGDLDGAPSRTNFWYQLFIYSFCVAALLGVVGFCAWIVLKKPPVVVAPPPVAVAVPLRFTITQSAVHRTKKGMEAHTFLLNQQTGEVWQMVCDGPSGAVSFRRVPWLDLNKNPEKVEAGRKP
jgi:hypothetical protein